MGFASSRKEARQIVSHNHVLLNGKRSNISSMLVRKGDVVEIAPDSKGGNTDQRYMRLRWQEFYSSIFKPV